VPGSISLGVKVFGG